MSSTAEVHDRVLPEDRNDLTWKEFLELPDDDRYRHAELVDGRLVLLVNPPKLVHQDIVGSIFAMIWTWIRAGSGPGRVTMDPPVQIAERRGYLPDIAWFREENASLASGEHWLTAAPDLAIEVLSESTRRFDLVRKRRDYAAIGVRELWLIDPDGAEGEPCPTAMVLRLPTTPTDPPEFVVVDDLDPSGELTSPLLPGVTVRLADLVQT